MDSKKPGKQADSGDLEGDADSGDEEKAPAIKVLIINDDGVAVSDASQVKPGSMVIVASDWGGCDKYGFAPGSTEQVNDLSLSARELSKRSAAIVFTPAIVKGWAANDCDSSELVASARRMIRKASEEDINEKEAKAAFFDWVDVSESMLRSDIIGLAGKLREQRSAVDLLRNSGEVFGLVVRSQRPTAEDLADDVIGLQRTVDVSLDDHCRGVAEYAALRASAASSSGSATSVIRSRLSTSIRSSSPAHTTPTSCDI